MPLDTAAGVGCAGSGRSEYARKLLQESVFAQVRALGARTVNPSRKLRRFESFTCHHDL
jgi:hypothetical protein